MFLTHTRVRPSNFSSVHWQVDNLKDQPIKVDLNEEVENTKERSVSNSHFSFFLNHRQNMQNTVYFSSSVICQSFDTV
mgnify:CR=1 FL=1